MCQHHSNLVIAISRITVDDYMVEYGVVEYACDTGYWFEPGVFNVTLSCMNDTQWSDDVSDGCARERRYHACHVSESFDVLTRYTLICMMMFVQICVVISVRGSFSYFRRYRIFDMF